MNIRAKRGMDVGSAATAFVRRKHVEGIAIKEQLRGRRPKRRTILKGEAAEALRERLRERYR